MKQSAGLLLYRQTKTGLEVLLVHPGGPFWAKKDASAWSIPKGEVEPDEDPLAAAKREFAEELGKPAPMGEYKGLGTARQSNKVVYAWAVEADLDVATIVSNTLGLEWPPKSGQQQTFPEIDKAAWFSLERARTKLVKGQVSLLDALTAQLHIESVAKESPKPEQARLF